MNCIKCDKKAINENPNLCKKHFIEYYENKVLFTIKKFNLIKKEDKILVATSGGKDSMAVTHILSKHYDIDLLFINEGISNYREHTKKALLNYCKNNNINLIIKSFEDCVGLTLDKITKKIDDIPCSICGVLRRYLLNQYSQEYDLIVTGHNADDEAQTVLMNLYKNQPHLIARSGPITGFKSHDKFTKKIKPLYYCRERENMLYVILNNLNIPFIECPYAKESFRKRIVESILKIDDFNERERLIFSLLELPKRINSDVSNSHHEISLCSKCKMPSERKICRVCELKNRINKK
ncbi:MAG: ATP-binding protein [Candidatus Woesearchaeota archaeon]